MSLNMYLGETDTQKNSMNTMCINMIQAMEQVQSSIHSFTQNLILRSQTYDSAKAYMNRVYIPLTQGIIYLCEELIRQNDKYPNDFRAEVASTDVIEQEVQAQIDEINLIITQLEKWNESLPLFGMKIAIYQHMKHKLSKKLSDLYTFNSTSSNNYAIAMQFAASVLEGLNQVQDGKNFSKASGTFSTDGMDMSWVTDLRDTHYTRRAEEEFEDYIDGDPDKLEKAIEVLKYEEANPGDAEKVTEFLSPLEGQDEMEIKYLMYTTEEPYRTISMKYLDKFNIRDTDSGGLFNASENAIDFNVEKDRDNNRGNYYTFFHEIMHAADYYYGIDQGYDSHYSNHYESEDGKDLNYHMYNDAEVHFKKELTKELQDSKYDDLSLSEKQEMINNVTDNLMIQDDNYEDLSTKERKLNNTIRSHYEELLDGPAHNTASDVYGGITNLVISGSYGHQEKDGSASDYWFVNAVGGEDGERNREPNREGIAEYFGRIMTEDSDSRNAGLESIDEYLPMSKEFMDEIFDTMVE